MASPSGFWVYNSVGVHESAAGCTPLGPARYLIESLEKLRTEGLPMKKDLLAILTGLATPYNVNAYERLEIL